MGLIALQSTALDPNEEKGMLVRDLLHWDSELPVFLQDVLEGKLHYYHGPHHRKTSRYLQGKNPEIFSVIRYFVAVAKYPTFLA